MTTVLTTKAKLIILATFAYNLLAHTVLLIVLVTIIMMLIFGGEFSLSIDFESFDNLLTTIDTQ